MSPTAQTSAFCQPLPACAPSSCSCSRTRPRPRFCFRSALVAASDLYLPGAQNLFSVIGNSISIHGVNVVLLAPAWQDEFYATVPRLIAQGEIKCVSRTWE